MTIQAALDCGIRFVRKPFWNDRAKLELPERLPNGFFGPWGKLHDLGEVTPILMFTADDGLDDWEETPDGSEEKTTEE